MKPDRETIRAALDIACRAPSVHNTQPWRWVVADDSVHLFADRSRRLPVIDRDGRELTISCGAALHHARIAFRSLGWQPKVRRLPDPARADHLAAVALFPADGLDQRVGAMVSATAARRTDRRPYLPDPVSAPLLDRLVGAALAEGITMTPLVDPVRRRETAVALAHTDATQRANPMYQAEIGEWAGRRTGAVHGVPARNVPAPSPRAMTGRWFGHGELEGPAPTDDGALLCLLSTATDGPMDWLRTGEALSALLLAATRAGLATCPLSQVAELPVARDAIRRAALDGAGEPQLAVRIGWPVTAEFPGAPTPRRRLDDVIDTRLPR